MDRSANAAGVLEHSDTGAQENRVVTEEEWLQKWEMRNIGFHKEQGHPLLQKYLDVLLGGRSGLRIFFPLCGKAVDMKRLADMGHHVVGVEVSEQALKEFFAEHSLPYSEEPVPEIPGAKKLQSTSGNISLYCCSIYDLSSSVVGKFDGFWDRGALVAVNPCDRQRYASLMITLMEQNSSYLLVTVSYDPTKHKGPPFYVPESEINSLFDALGESLKFILRLWIRGGWERPGAWGKCSMMSCTGLPGFLPEKGDWLDKMIGEMEASVQGCLNSARIIAMEELLLMSELCEVPKLKTIKN
ncbi:thiopurine S-methyltransferase isoform X3 [Lathamus discolor]|uniref:thiopurine S-methyltransferase isoform X3 n=1 Tax=Lathamus discolor TaxID=678569 RepID=UPI0032B743C5